MRSILALILLWASCFKGQPADAAEVYVGVASNFSSTARQIAAKFNEETKHTAHLSFGSSGKLFAQIRQGAPFSLFLSADTAKPEALAALDMVAERRTYAVGKLVLWIPDPTDQPWQSQLLDQAIGKIAMANPRLAPYGHAARQVLENTGLETTADRWITGENIAQTFQFVSSGNAGAGFIAKSQIGAIGSSHVLVLELPTNLYDPIEQDVVLLKSGMQNAAAKDFYDFLASSEVISMIESAGYQVPNPAN